MFSATRPATRQVARFDDHDTDVKRIQRQIYVSDDQIVSQDNRQFVYIPMDAAVIYRWKFMIVNTSEASENEPNNIGLAYSNNPLDQPTQVPCGCRLLYNGVVHCLPHNQIFTEPICLSFILPDSVDLSQIRVMYSNTDVGDATNWTAMDRPQYLPASVSWHNRESGSYQNKAVLLADSRRLQLVLRHFCIFAILVEGQQELAQNLGVDAFLKIAVSSFRYTVHVLVVVGCNTDDQVSTVIL